MDEHDEARGKETCAYLGKLELSIAANVGVRAEGCRQEASDRRGIHRDNTTMRYREVWWFSSMEVAKRAGQKMATHYLFQNLGVHGGATGIVKVRGLGGVSGQKLQFGR